MVRGLALALAVTLTGVPVAGVLCAWACAAQAQAVATSGCHEQGSTPTGPGLTTVHVCDHDAAIGLFVPEVSRKAPASPSLVALLPPPTAMSAGWAISHPFGLWTERGGPPLQTRSTVLRV